MARVYADVNQHMPKAYWEYDSVNITWGVLENYEVVRKIGSFSARVYIAAALLTLLLDRPGEILRGIRGNQHCQLSKVRYKGS